MKVWRSPWGLRQVPSDKEKVKSRGTTANLGATTEVSADSLTSGVMTAYVRCIVDHASCEESS